MTPDLRKTGSDPLVLRLADLTVAVHGASDAVRPLFSDYCSCRGREGAAASTNASCNAALDTGRGAPDAPVNVDIDIDVHLTPDDLARERALQPDVPDRWIESAAIHRAVADCAPLYDRIVLHACVVEYRGRAYAFTAPSGTGKSTHASLWMRYLAPAASVLNGDKPLVHVPPTGGVIVWGTLWTGKEGWGRNDRAPLAGICLLHRADVCRAEAVPRGAHRHAAPVLHPVQRSRRRDRRARLHQPPARPRARLFPGLRHVRGGRAGGVRGPDRAPLSGLSG